jgi:dinuclear metal center YbgI/SA1388 family protein
MTDVATIAAYLDSFLESDRIPDYPGALNGLQLASEGEITHVATAVDVSRRVIEAVVRAGAGLLVVHHGMFWSGTQRIVGVTYERMRLLFAHNIAVYASHLPLDAHRTVGNNILLARALGLDPTGGFARHQTIEIGVTGECDLASDELLQRAQIFAKENGGAARSTRCNVDRRTRRWGICTGAGASSETLAEAIRAGIDTLVVGEGPHHTAVMADDSDLFVIYAGHYATETVGVRALGDHIASRFGIRSTFIPAPTGL